MAERSIFDRKGQSLKVIEYEGQLLQRFPAFGSRLDVLPSLTVRDGDVAVVGYPKSGNHWAWEIFHRIVTGKTGQFSDKLGDCMIDFQQDEHMREYPSPRVFVSHLPPELLSRADSLFDGTHKIVYIIRNPKDLAVSFYLQTYKMRILYEYDGDWEDYFELFLNGQVDSGSWFDHVLKWEKFSKDHPTIPIHFVFYENLSKDLMGEIKRLVRFLGANTDERFLSELYHASLFENMKRNHDSDLSEQFKSMYRDGIVDIFRKGVIGDWRNYFTTDQSKRLNSAFASKMKSSKLNFPFMDQLKDE